MSDRIKKEDRVIAKQEVFVSGDDDCIVIQKYTEVQPEEGKVILRSETTADITVPHPQNPEFKIPRKVGVGFAFPEGTSLIDAFDTYEEVSKQAKSDFEKKYAEEEAKRLRIAVPKKGSLVGMDGRPIGG